MGVDGALRRPTRAAALRQSRGRPLRPAPRHPVRHARRERGVRRGGGTLGRGNERRRPHHGHLLHHGDRVPVLPQPAEIQGRRCISRRALSHRLLAARGRGLHGQARGGHRHRLLRRAVDPHHRRRGRAPLRLPAHAQLCRARAQCAAGPRVRAQRQGGLSGDARPRQAEHDRHRLRLQRPRGARDRARGAHVRVRAALAARRLVVPRCLQGPDGRPGGQRHGGRVRARQDPLARQRSRHCRGPSTEEYDRLQAAVRRHRLLRDLQPGQRQPHRHQRVRRSRRSPARASGSAAGTTRWTPSCSPPASMP